VGTGSFGDYKYDPSGTAWTFSSQSGVAGNGSGFTAGNPAAPEGTQVGFLQKTGSISQAVTLAAGTYDLTFSAAQRGNYGRSTQAVQVQVDGSVVGTFTPAGTSYATITTNSFNVAAGSHTIKFVGLNPNGGDNTALLDNVSIAASGGAPPSGTKLALSGTAYRWWDMSTPTATTNQTTAPQLNDNNLQTGVTLSGSGLDGAGDDAPNAYEAAGVLWSAAQNLKKVVFTNGAYTSSQDGVFDANFGLQFTTDGIHWTNATGWSVSPAYAYNSSRASGVSYVFTGPAARVLGFRVVGQVYTSPTGVNSWYDNANEVQAFGPAT
jgi:hypothetical protein